MNYGHIVPFARASVNQALQGGKRLQDGAPPVGRDNGRILQRGAHLYHAGDRVGTPYLVVAGVLKSYLTDEEGQEQVTGFHVPGDIIAFEGLVGRMATCAVLALDTAKVHPVRAPLAASEADGEGLADAVVLSGMYREIQRLTDLLQLLNRPIEARLARFLIHQGEQQARRGCRRTEFFLPMGRRDLANYLGVAPETLSRIFGRLREHGVLSVRNAHIRILDSEALRRSAGIASKADPGSRGGLPEDRVHGSA